MTARAEELAIMIDRYAPPRQARLAQKLEDPDNRFSRAR